MLCLAPLLVPQDFRGAAVVRNGTGKLQFQVLDVGRHRLLLLALKVGLQENVRRVHQLAKDLQRPGGRIPCERWPVHPDCAGKG